MERPLEPVGRAIGYTHRDKGDADCLAYRSVLIASKLGSYRDRGYSDTPRYRSSRASALLRGMWASVGARLARESADRLPLWERCLPAMKATRTVWLTGVFLSRASSAPTGIQFRLGHRVIVHRGQARLHQRPSSLSCRRSIPNVSTIPSLSSHSPSRFVFCEAGL